MKRFSFNLLAGVSLLLCAASVMMWVRSYNRADNNWLFFAQDGVLTPNCSHGRIEFGRLYAPEPVGKVIFDETYPSYKTYPSYSSPPAPPEPLIEVQPHYTVWRFCGLEEREGKFVPTSSRVVRTFDRTEYIDAISITPYRLWTIPFWFPTLLFSLVPARWLIGFAIQSRRTRKGAKKSLVQLRRKQLGRPVCPSCGYDLRASLDRCPECGAQPIEIHSSQ